MNHHLTTCISTKGSVPSPSPPPSLPVLHTQTHKHTPPPLPTFCLYCLPPPPPPPPPPEACLLKRKNFYPHIHDQTELLLFKLWRALISLLPLVFCSPWAYGPVPVKGRRRLDLMGNRLKHASWFVNINTLLCFNFN